jgi:hypothetical protein
LSLARRAAVGPPRRLARLPIARWQVPFRRHAVGHASGIARQRRAPAIEVTVPGGRVSHREATNEQQRSRHD